MMLPWQCEAAAPSGTAACWPTSQYSVASGISLALPGAYERPEQLPYLQPPELGLQQSGAGFPVHQCWADCPDSCSARSVTTDVVTDSFGVSEYALSSVSSAVTPGSPVATIAIALFPSASTVWLAATLDSAVSRHARLVPICSDCNRSAVRIPCSAIPRHTSRNWNDTCSEDDLGAEREILDRHWLSSCHFRSHVSAPRPDLSM